MPLVTSQTLLHNAQKGHYAVTACNVENMEMVQAVIAAAEEMHAPIIMQTTPSTVRYGSLALFYAMASAAAKASSAQVALHLDHGESFDMAVMAIREGYTSIMIDGSHLNFEDNIALTKRVVDVARPNNIPVEAELGKVGGKEDDLDGGDDCGYTEPLEAKEFVERTGISSLAIAIGTAHGLYKGVPKLDIQRLTEIRKVVNIPLVLHGGSGLLDVDVIKCIQEGICKVNYATELRIAFSDGVKSVLTAKPDTFDPKAFGKVGREYVKEFVKSRILVCGSQDMFC